MHGRVPGTARQHPPPQEAVPVGVCSAKPQARGADEARRTDHPRGTAAAVGTRPDVPFSRDAERSAARLGSWRAALRRCAAQQMERGYDGACTERGLSPLRPADRAHAPASVAGYDRRGDYRRDGGRRDDRDDRDRRPRSSSRDRSPKRSRRESPHRGGRGRDDGQYGAWQRSWEKVGAASRCSECRGSIPAPTLTRRCVLLRRLRRPRAWSARRRRAPTVSATLGLAWLRRR